MRPMPPTDGAPSSWGKIPLIHEHLKHDEFVLWIDSDALIVGEMDFRSLIQPTTLNISKDVNGINCGVMAWMNCQEAFDSLLRIQSMREQFKEHIWFEQAALMTFVDEINVTYLEKSVFNAYPEEASIDFSDVSEQTQIIHWPGMSEDDRIPYMEAILS